NLERRTYDVPIRGSFKKDSCVVIYWKEEELPPGGKSAREMAFTYGLGNLDTKTGNLGVTVAGDFAKGGDLTVVGLANDPKIKSLTLKLDDGLKLIDGGATQDVAQVKGRPSPVTWRIRSTASGTFNLEVQASTGEVQKKRVRIKASGIF